jgi:branched-subunit amino acid ABC-type transport system permease component
MNSTLLIEQLLNGLQFGLMLFLIAAGLTLVFGIMDVLNLAHGSLYMIGPTSLRAWRRRAAPSGLPFQSPSSALDSSAWRWKLR